MARLLHLPELLVSTLADHTVREPEPQDRTTTHRHHPINETEVPPEQRGRGRQNQDPEHDRSLRTLDLVSSATLR